MSVLNSFKTELFASAGSWNGDPDPAFPLLFHKNPASRASVLAIPNIIFVPNPAFELNFGKSIFPGSSQIPSSVIVSRISHCILAKSRIPEMPSYSLYYFLCRIIHETNGFSKKQLQSRHIETIIPFQHQ